MRARKCNTKMLLTRSLYSLDYHHKKHPKIWSQVLEIWLFCGAELTIMHNMAFEQTTPSVPSVKLSKLEQLPPELEQSGEDPRGSTWESQRSVCVCVMHLCCDQIKTIILSSQHLDMWPLSAKWILATCSAIVLNKFILNRNVLKLNMLDIYHITAVEIKHFFKRSRQTYRYPQYSHFVLYLASSHLLSGRPRLWKCILGLFAEGEILTGVASKAW